MELIYADHDMNEIGILKNPEYDLAFGEDENDFECKISLTDHCCKEGYYIYAEGTEYGGIVDAIEIDSENDIVIYTGRSWHGILASKVIEPLKASDKTEITIEVEHKSRLPEGYTELEYIESVDGAYINTEIIADQDTSIEMIATPISESATVAGYVFFYGAATSHANNGFDLFSQQGKLLNVYGNSVLYPGTLEFNKKMHIVHEKNKITISTDNVTVPQTHSTSTFTTPRPLYLFAMNRGSLFAGSRLRIHKTIIAKSSTQRDYIPCKSPNKEVGLYDLVSSRFFGNAGTGYFEAGGEVGNTQAQVVGKVETTDADNNSLLNRYLTLSGDVSGCTKYIVDRINLAPLFKCSEKLADVDLPAYTFDRYIDAYSGLRDMLASCGMRLAITCEDRTVNISAVPIFDFSDGKEFESDLVGYQMKKTYNNVNHLICVGSGKYGDRQIVHLYLDANGNVSETQTFTGKDERIQFDGEQDEPEEAEEAKTAEQIAEERANLIESGTKKLLDMQTADEIDVSFDATEDNYYIGDIVGAYDSTTDISVSAAVVKKIISIANSKTNIEYKVGAKNG